MSEAAKRLSFATFVTVSTVLLSRVLGFLRDAYIAAHFGANGATDAFYAAFTIPDMLNYLVAGGTLSITFIPLYTRYLAKEDEAEGNRVLGIIATVMGALLLVGIIGLEYFTPTIVGHYLHKLRPEDRTLAIELTRILLPAQFFFYLGGLAAATLYARQKFVEASWAPILYNLGTIVGGVLLGSRLGIHSLAWGTLGGAAVGPFLVTWYFAARHGARYRPSFAIRHPDLRAWIYVTLPLMIGVSLIVADEWIMRYFAGADEGAISCLSYARKLVSVPIALAGQAVGQASMPFFARLYAEQKLAELGELVRRSATGAAEVSLLAGAGLVATSVPLTDLLFRRGSFSTAQVIPTALYLSIFAGFISLWAMQGILSRAYYATGNTLAPMVSGTLVTVVSLPIYYALFRLVGTAGLVWASGIGITMHTLALIILLPRRMPFTAGPLLMTLGRAAVVGVIATAAGRAVGAFVPAMALPLRVERVMQLTIVGVVFLAVALPLANLMQLKVFPALVGSIWRRVRRA